MAPRYGGVSGGGASSGGMRGRILPALCFGAIIGLTLSIGRLHLSIIQREAAAAIEIAQEHASKAVWAGNMLL